MKIEPPQERKFEVFGGEGRKPPVRKPPVRQLILLDGVLLAAAFFINLKCARKLHGMLSPEAFWGRLFVWIWWKTLELGLFWYSTLFVNFRLNSGYSDQTCTEGTLAASPFIFMKTHFMAFHFATNFHPLQFATRVENFISCKQEMDTKDCTECSFCVTVLLLCAKWQIRHRHDIFIWHLHLLPPRAFLNDLESLVEVFLMGHRSLEARKGDEMRFMNVDKLTTNLPIKFMVGTGWTGTVRQENLQLQSFRVDAIDLRTLQDMTCSVPLAFVLLWSSWINPDFCIPCPLKSTWSRNFADVFLHSPRWFTANTGSHGIGRWFAGAQWAQNDERSGWADDIQFANVCHTHKK